MFTKPARFHRIPLAVLVPLALLVACGGDDEAPAPVTSTDNLTGTVTDAEGNGVGDAQITVGDQTAVTDPEGKYEIAAPSLGSVTIQVTADWFQDTQESAEIVGGANVVDVQMVAHPLKVEAADKTLADTYNATFDWTTDKVMVAYVSPPTRGAIDKALYYQNPALYEDTTSDPITPATPPSLTGGLDFELEGSTEQALDNSSVVDTLGDTGLSQAEQDGSLLWEPAIDLYLGKWDEDKSADLYLAGLAVRRQAWEGTARFPPQYLQHLYLQSGEIWVELVFEPWLTVDSSITDSDGDGLKEIYAKVNPTLYTTELYDELSNVYASEKFDTLGLKRNVPLILDDLYSRTNPKIESTIGVPYDAEGVGTFEYPTVVLSHSNNSINVLLVEP